MLLHGYDKKTKKYSGSAEYNGDNPPTNTTAEPLPSYNQDTHYLTWNNGWSVNIIIPSQPNPFVVWNGSEWVVDDSRKQDIIDSLVIRINNQTDDKILNDFVYNNIPFYLSLENQINYKTLYDTRNEPQRVYPYQIKGKGDNDFMTVESAQDISDMFWTAQDYITTCISDGWVEKVGLYSLTASELVDIWMS